MAAFACSLPDFSVLVPDAHVSPEPQSLHFTHSAGKADGDTVSWLSNGQCLTSLAYPRML